MKFVFRRCTAVSVISDSLNALLRDKRSVYASHIWLYSDSHRDNAIYVHVWQLRQCSALTTF